MDNIIKNNNNNNKISFLRGFLMLIEGMTYIALIFSISYPYFYTQVEGMTLGKYRSGNYDSMIRNDIIQFMIIGIVDLILAGLSIHMNYVQYIGQIHVSIYFIALSFFNISYAMVTYFKKESFKNTSAERTNLRYLKPIYSNCINRESWWDSFEKFLDAYDEKSVNLSEKHIIEIIAVFCYYINVKSLHCRLPQKIKTHPNYKYFETFGFIPKRNS